MGEPTFWDDPDKAAKVTKDVTDLKAEVEGYDNLVASLDDLEVLQGMAEEEQDESLIPELDAALAEVREKLQHLELGMLLSEEYDANNAILTLHAGAGGTEAQDWTSMLLRMFTRFAEQNGYAVETLDFQAGDEAGVKSATLQINGHNAYGFFRSEKGVHRLVRISPFDANARRHTSFAAVDVMPELDETVHVDINMKDVRVDYYRASGAGGQQDFVLGAYLSRGGKSFICCSSTYVDKNGTSHSRIVPSLAQGTAVTEARPNTMYVVTEYGAVNLKGMTTWQRAEALIGIANPIFRDKLIAQAEKQGIWRAFSKY